MNRGAPIGIFDSGVGGLGVFEAIKSLLPQESLLYFADTAHLPYGDKSPEEILYHATNSALYLEQQGVKALVIACNTACSIALTPLRQMLSIPIIGIIEQGIQEVLEHFPSHKVALLTTQATLNSQFYQQRFMQKSSSLKLFPQACPLFVPLIEKGLLDHPLTYLAAHNYLSPLRKENLDAALLGCTHYPLLSTPIQHTLGSFVTLIDPTRKCAHELQLTLAQNDLFNTSPEPPSYQFYTSDRPERFSQLATSLL